MALKAFWSRETPTMAMVFCARNSCTSCFVFTMVSFFTSTPARRGNQPTRNNNYSITTIWWPSTEGTTILTRSPSEVKGTCTIDGAQ